VFGVGEAGSAFASYAWPGHNCLIFSALPDEQVEQVAVWLKVFHGHLEQRQGARIPLWMFLLL
jgi:hypothetical protein